MLLACVLLGCNKSDEGSETPKEVGAEADYTLLVSVDGMLKAQPLNATSEALTINPGESPFAEVNIPQPTFKEGSVLSMYHEKTACTGEVTQYDFSDHSSKNFEVFSDLGSCNLTASAIAHSGTAFFISYAVEETSTTNYFVRVLDMDGTKVIDIPLDKKPLQMVVAKNRLFIMNFDTEVTGENGLTVLDLSNNTLINEINLGFDARQIFRNTDDNLVISYDGLHTLLNVTTMGVQYVNYEAGKEPDFALSGGNHLDNVGKLYYKRPTGETTHPNIPAIYDFTQNVAYVYAYENFLSQTQIEFEFEIGNTTMVCYDAKNNYMLVGYLKAGSTDMGGILRIKPGTEPQVIDNVDVAGVPYDIFMK